MKIIVRDEAATDLESAFAWTAKDDPAAAVELVRRIRDRLARLATPGFSHMGRLGLVSGTRELVEPPYIIVYHVDEDRHRAVVLAIVHARRERG